MSENSTMTTTVSPSGPNHTLYINNLNDKLSKEFLKQMLYMMCSEYGRIVDLVALKGPKNKGQAFVVFQEISSATLALKNLNGRLSFGKPMKIAFAKTKSKKILQLEGSLNGDEDAKESSEYEPAAKRIHRMRQQENQQRLEDATTLFVENIPQNTSEEAISTLFKSYPGYMETRMATSSNKSKIAFIEFSTHLHACTAKNVMNHFKINPTHELRITFAKK